MLPTSIPGPFSTFTLSVITIPALSAVMLLIKIALPSFAVTFPIVIAGNTPAYVSILATTFPIETQLEVIGDSALPHAIAPATFIADPLFVVMEPNLTQTLSPSPRHYIEPPI